MVGVLIRIVAWLTFLVAVVLTALRFVQPDVPGVQLAVAFLPLTVPLFALAMLLFVFLVFFPGKTRWQITMALAGLALAGLLVQGWWLSPLFRGSTKVDQNAQTVRVLTVNLRTGQADPADLVSTAVGDGVDLLVLQEVTGGALDALEQVGLDTAFPHRAGQPETNGKYGTVMLSTGNIASVTFLGSTQSSVQAQVTLPGGTVWALGVGVPSPGGSRPTPWQVDLDQLVQTVRALHPAIVAGDLEASFGHRPFEDLLDSGLRDAGEEADAGWQPTYPANRTTFGVTWPRVTQPDHVLVGDRVTAVDQVTVPIPGSDHRGVLATLTLG